MRKCMFPKEQIIGVPREQEAGITAVSSPRPIGKASQILLVRAARDTGAYLRLLT